MQSAFSDGVAFDPFSLKQDDLAASEVDVGWCEVYQALVIASMIVVFDEASDVSFEIAGQVVVLKQDAVFEGLVPSLDLALCLRMMWRAAHVVHAVFVELFCNIGRDVTRSVIAEQSRFVDDTRAITA